MAMQFKKAERKQARLRLAITGPSGSGKSWGALTVAKGMGGKIAVIDTERGSASLYSHLTDFDTLELEPPFTPERFIEAIHAAEGGGYDTIIIDSMTHEWDGAGGCLELNELIAKTQFKGNTWSAWSETTPRHRSFVDAILQSKCHIIATMRSKTETVQEGGKVKKVGMKDVQRDGTDYEFAVVLNLEHSGHYATAGKDRTGLFLGDPKPITVATGKMLIDWLNSGAKVVDEPKAVTTGPVMMNYPLIDSSNDLVHTGPTLVMMNDDQIGRIIDLMHDAPTMVELKAVWASAYTAFKSRGQMTDAQLAKVKSAYESLRDGKFKVEPAKPQPVTPPALVTEDAF